MTLVELAHQKETPHLFRTDEAAERASIALRQTLEQVLRHLALVVAYDSAAILLRDGQGLHVAAAQGLPESEIRHTLEPANRCRCTLADSVMRSGRPLVVSDAQRHPLWTPTIGTSYIHAWVGIPLRNEKGVIGVINADKRETAYYTEKDVQVLSAFADQAVAVLEKASLAGKLHRLHIDTILALVRAVEARDPYTGGHSRRAAEIAVMLGALLRLPEDQLNLLQVGGLLHDVGKVSINDAILLKPGELSAAERAIIQTHPRRGWNIVGDIAELNYLKPIILWHHERYDGQGYPDRLKGHEIPLLARIMAVADSFEAMRSSRAYRPAIPLSRIIEIFRADGGKQWEQGIVSVLLDNLAGIGGL